MSPWHNYALLLVLAFSLVQPPITQSLFNKFHVHVGNGLSNATFNAHCYSKDDDLGTHVLPGQAEFSWKFRINLKANTKFFCKTWWAKGRLDFVSFHVEEKFLMDDCGATTCVWTARDDGMYLYRYKNHSLVKTYDWVK